MFHVTAIRFYRKLSVHIAPYLTHNIHLIQFPATTFICDVFNLLSCSGVPQLIWIVLCGGIILEFLTGTGTNLRILPIDVLRDNFEFPFSPCPILFEENTSVERRQSYSYKNMDTHPKPHTVTGYLMFALHALMRETQLWLIRKLSTQIRLNLKLQPQISGRHERNVHYAG